MCFPNNIAKIFLRLLAIIWISDIAGAADGTDISRLRAKILQDYDIHSRPIQKQNDTTVMDLSFYFNGFELDEQRNKMTLFVVSVMTWQDEHVKWDPLDYGNLEEITFTNNQLWTPDLTVLNNFDQSKVNHFDDSSLMVALPSSTIWWIPFSKFETTCTFDFTFWPYDKQTCSVILGSWAYGGEELDIKLRSNISQLIIDTSWVEHFYENKEWSVLHTKISRQSQIFHCCPKIDDVTIEIQLSFARKTSSHTTAVTVVGIGIATAILVSFWLDPFAPERLPVILVLLLLNCMYLQHLHKIIPNNGAVIPLSIRFFRDSLVMVTAAFAWTVGIRYLAKTRRDLSIPMFIRTFLDSCLATVLCLKPRSQTEGHHGGEWKSDDDESGLMGTNSVQEDWEWLARCLDRVAFLVYLVVYSIFVFTFI